MRHPDRFTKLLMSAIHVAFLALLVLGYAVVATAVVVIALRVIVSNLGVVIFAALVWGLVGLIGSIVRTLQNGSHAH